MTPEFERALARTVKIEGGYVDNPVDRGGPTNLGVTFGTLDKWMQKMHGRPAAIDDLKTLSHEQAEALYYDLYWSEIHLPCQRVAEWWEPMGAEVFDSAVLHGPVRSAVFLQRALNILNLNERAWPDTKVDGWVGAATLSALPLLDRLPRGKERLMVWVNGFQAKFMIEIAENDPTQEEFIGGWGIHRVQLGGDWK